MVGVSSSEFYDSLTPILRRAAFEIVALCAGTLGPLPIAAQSVIMTFDQSQSQSYKIDRYH